MDATVKEKWIAALKSGDYKQTRNHLRVGDSFCCLGVLCDLYKREQEDKGDTDSITWERDECSDIQRLSKDDDWVEDLPPNYVLDWAGLVGADWNSLATLNDDGSTFDKIAEIINEQI